MVYFDFGYCIRSFGCGVSDCIQLYFTDRNGTIENVITEDVEDKPKGNICKGQSSYFSNIWRFIHLWLLSS